MPNNKDIFRNKRDFAHEEFATELYKPPGKPRAREAKSQRSQVRAHHPGDYKARKHTMADKT
ncbi:MAG TPA: hypothetical protein GX517_06110 [Alicyclobacillus sp.]|nr:hypothetical protein [Alicyclobacillus sp.]